MKARSVFAAVALAGAGLFTASSAAPAPASEAMEQFFPVLVFRSGPYAPNGIPWANGFVDYLKLVNARDGGINGVKITYEECETGYATDRGVECYERLKGKGPTGATSFSPLSTGITFALTEKAPADKIPLVTMGYGRSESKDGRAFAWNFPLLGTYWDAADVLIQHVSAKVGSAGLKGKKITLIYHDSPYGKEPIPVFEELARRRGFEFTALPVAHPGLEQKSVWLQVRHERPDFVFLWGWGAMNSTALREATAVGYPRQQMYGVWWAGAEQDVLPSGPQATGYNALTLQHSAELARVHRDLLVHLHDKGLGTGKREEVGQVLYNRGMLNAMLTVEAVRAAQGRYGKKPMTGEQVRWGLEHLDIDSERIKALGVERMLQPLKTSCEDHEGAHKYRVHTWDGKRWFYSSDWYESNAQFLQPMLQAAAQKYVASKQIEPRQCSVEG